MRARLNVRKVRGSSVVEPYSDVVTQKEEGVKEYLELLNRLMGGSSSVEAAEMKGKEGEKVCGLPRTHYAQSDILSGEGGWDVMPEEERVTTY